MEICFGIVVGMKPSLLQEAQRLPVEERIELVGAIWDTLEEASGPEALSVSAAHRAELDRRLADLEANPDAGSSWEEVRGRLERRR
jgi:putative addiction module component (TIGR02574 family)